MEIGKLNQRIDIEKNTVVVSEVGYAQNKWIKDYSCWCNVTVNSSNEDATSAVAFDDLTFQFIVRANSSTKKITTTNYRIVFNGEYYNITSVIYDYLNKNYIRFEAELLKKGD